MAKEAIGVWAEKTLGLGENDYFAGAGLLARQDSRYIFAVPSPERWQQVDGRIEAALTGIDGRMEPGEGVMGCIEREVSQAREASAERGICGWNGNAATIG